MMITRQSVSVLFIILAAAIFNVSCKQTPKGYVIQDTPKSGTIYISVDESFKPVISQEILVFESTYPDAHIIADYKSEADCFKDLEKDSTRLIIVARGLTHEEGQYYKSKLSYTPKWDAVAYDAVDVVLNAGTKDSVFTLKKLKDLLNGTDTTKDVAVDGKNATSTVRYLVDSFLNGKQFGANVKAAPGSKGVVDYVSRNPNAVGFVGSSWVGNEEDPEQKEYLSKVITGIVEVKHQPGYFARPSQATIGQGQYPLVRPLFYILKENTVALGSAFTTFMGLQRGQLIFRRSYLVPAKMDFNIRSGGL